MENRIEEVMSTALRSVRDLADVNTVVGRPFTLADGRTVIVLAQGRLVNLSCAEGHPASVMDMSFANQALAAEYLYLHAGELENKVYDVPAAIDDGVARVKLETLGIAIDTLTEEQIAYMGSWNFETL